MNKDLNIEFINPQQIINMGGPWVGSLLVNEQKISDNVLIDNTIYNKESNEVFFIKYIKTSKWCKKSYFTVRKFNLKTKQVYQHNYDAEFLELDTGTSAKHQGGVTLYDNLISTTEKYIDSDVKLFTISRELSVRDARDAAVKKAIEANKIFINAYGNTNTRVFNDGEADMWLTVVGVENKFGRYRMRGYVNKDLSQVTKANGKGISSSAHAGRNFLMEPSSVSIAAGIHPG